MRKRRAHRECRRHSTEHFPRLLVRSSAAEWRTVFARFQTSGQDQIKFCRAEKITLSTFRPWQSRLRGRVEVSDFVPVIKAIARTEPDPGAMPPSGTAA